MIRPDGEDTLNYLDTGGLPLTKSQKSEAAALCAYMVGTSANEDIQRMRLALFARYIDQLYTDTFEDWARSRPRRSPARRAGSIGGEPLASGHGRGIFVSGSVD